MNINEAITEATFEAEVLKSEQPVLVAFGTPWSRPCRILDPILQELAHDWAGTAKVVSVNADDSLNLSLYYEILSIPTLLYFVEGKLRVRIVGTATKSAIIAKLEAIQLSAQNFSEAGLRSGAATSKGGGQTRA